MRELPKRDPIVAHARKVTAQRRIGKGKRCKWCGESRPEALIEGSNPVECFECERKKLGQNTLDAHHVTGKSNSAVTIPVPANDHRAILTSAQYDWPKKTRENPDGSPLLAAAACIRGFVDTIFYVIDKLVVWIPEMLEELDAFLVDEFGRKWWVGTELEPFAPKRRRSKNAP